MLLLSFGPADTLPAQLQQHLDPRPPGKDSVIPQPLRQPQSSFAQCFFSQQPTQEVADPSLKSLSLVMWSQRTWAESQGPELVQASLGARGVGGLGTMAPPGSGKLPSQHPCSCYCLLSGPLLQPEMCPRPLRA